jgi:hypothetical protein
MACLLALGAAGLAQGQVVISQVYGGGGNSGATFKNDFIELFNRGSAPVSLSGWSVQYASSAGSSWQVTALTAVTLQPGQYYLVQEAKGSGGSVDLPTPDATGSIAMSATAGKVALCSNATALTGTCPTGLVDFVGFGSSTNCSETSTTQTLTNTTAAMRVSNGCIDTNNNGADFVVGAPNPRNSTTLSPCSPSTPPTGVGAASPNAECPGSSNPVTLTVTVTPGASPVSTDIQVSGDLTAIGGSTGVQFYDDGPIGGHGDAVAGDNVFTTTALLGSVTAGNKNIPITITDGQSRIGNASIGVTVNNCGVRGFGNASPAAVCNGTSTLLFVDVTPGAEPASTGIQVVADLSAIGGSSTQQLYDDGTNGDLVAGDNRFSFSYTFTPGLATPDTHQVFFVVSDEQGRNNSLSNAHFPVSNADCVDSGASVVISQVYGGGGNGGALYNHDFVELFNRTNASVDLSNWSVQYASASSAGGFAAETILPAGTTIAANSYLLIQEAAGADLTQPSLPTPDIDAQAIGTPIAMSLSDGRVALVNTATLLGANCTGGSAEDSSVVDLVGYGSAICWEGIDAAPTTDNTVSIQRTNSGCQDSNNNNIDFFKAAPAPRNSASPVHVCNAPPPRCCLSDFNGDGDIGTDLDIESFFSCLAGNCCPSCPPNADFNCDGDIGTDTDIESFFRVLAGGAC